jgi:hypothetical protein
MLCASDESPPPTLRVLRQERGLVSPRGGFRGATGGRARGAGGTWAESVSLSTSTPHSSSRSAQETPAVASPSAPYHRLSASGSLPDFRAQSRNKVLQSGLQQIATLSQVVSPDGKSPITHALAAGTRLASDCENELLCEGCEQSFLTARLTFRLLIPSIAASANGRM